MPGAFRRAPTRGPPVVMFLGDHSELRLTLASGGRLLAAVPGPAVFSSGAATSVTLPPDAFLDAP